MASIHCMANQFRKWPKSMRIWLVFILFAIFVSTNFIESIRLFCQQYNVGCAAWLLPLAMAKLNHSLWIMLLPILLFCDAPFLDEQQPFLIIRTGRLRWAVGQILYIFFASAVFYFICMGITVLLMIPYVEFTPEWGKVIHTLTQSFVAASVDMDVIPATIVENYTAIQAALLCGGATWIAVSFLGLLMFLCNLWSRREIGIIIASCFAGLSYFIELMGIPYRYWYAARYISPVSWINLANIGDGTISSPSWEYVFFAGFILLLVLVIAILLFIRKKSIEVVQVI